MEDSNYPVQRTGTKMRHDMADWGANHDNQGYSKRLDNLVHSNVTLK